MVSFFQCRRVFACLPHEAESVPPIHAADGKTGSAGGVDRKSTRLNSSHIQKSRMPSSA